MRDRREGKRHGTAGFPLAAYVVREESVNFAVSPHWHSEVEFLHILEGYASVQVGETIYCGQPGDVFVINTGVLHSVTVHTPPLSYNALVFSLGLLRPVLQGGEDLDILTPLCAGRLALRAHIPAAEAKPLRPVLLQCTKLAAAPPQGGLLQMRGLLLVLVGMMAQRGYTGRAQPLESLREDTPAGMLRYINAHSAERLRLDDVAEQFGFAPKYLCSYFKKHFGMGFNEYLTGVRLEKAAALLLAGHTSVEQVARAVGYDNTSHFIGRFKARFECTPAVYRKSLDKTKAGEAMHNPAHLQYFGTKKGK